MSDWKDVEEEWRKVNEQLDNLPIWLYAGISIGIFIGALLWAIKGV